MIYRILFLTNNFKTLPIYDWLITKKEYEIFLSTEKISQDSLTEFIPNFIISYNYKYLIKKEIIDRFSNSIINLHISYLPWNRGSQPNLWSFLEDTPKGVTIHLIDEGIDTGKILLQKQIEFDEDKETLKSSYDRLNIEIQELFINNWDSIKSGDLKSEEQTGTGSIHYKKDFEKIKHLLEPHGWNIPISLLKERYKKYLASL